MVLVRNFAAGLIIFGLLVIMLITAYTGLTDPQGYNITQGYNKTLSINNQSGSGNIVEQFQRMNLVNGTMQLQNEMLELKTQSGSSSDITGSLITSGIGGLFKVIVGTVTAPFEIANIITAYYTTEATGFIVGLALIGLVYVVFVFLSAFIGKDV